MVVNKDNRNWIGIMTRMRMTMTPMMMAMNDDDKDDDRDKFKDGNNDGNDDNKVDTTMARGCWG